MKKLLFFCILLCQMVCVKAQTGLFFGSDRLTSTVITSICQDKTNYIWVGTEYGLNRFDGYHFTHYLHQEGDSTSLLFNTVTTLFCDNQGRLWVGTTKGLQRYDEATNSFTTYTFPEGHKPHVSQLYQLRSGELLVGTSGYGLCQVLPNSTKLVERTDYKVDEHDNYFNNLYEDATGTLWKSGAGRFCCMPKGRPAQQFDTSKGIPTSIFGYQGNIVALSRDDFQMFTPPTANQHQTPVNPFDISVLGSNAGFRTALIDQQGNIYVGTLGSGLFWIPAGTNKLIRHPVRMMGLDLKSVKIWALAEDRQGNIWVGCQQHGVLMIPNRQSRFTSWSFAAQKRDIGTYVSSVCPGEDGIVWCTVQYKGVFGFNADGDIVANPQAPDGAEVIYRNDQNEYWLGTRNGLFEYNPLTGKSRLLTNYACDKFNAVVDDGHGHLVISAFSKGILVYDKAQRTMAHYDMNDPEDAVNGRLCNNWVLTMTTDREGNVWMGTGAGVSCYNPQTRSFKPYDWQVLADGTRCNAFCETRQGDMLIGTSQGLYIWRRQSNLVEQMPHAEQLYSLAIFYIVEDSNGDLWCSTSNGIWHYQSARQHWVSYINGAGLTTHEYVGSAGLHTNDDRIYFATSDGLTTFTPQQVCNGQTSKAELLLTDFIINETPVSTLTESDGHQVTKLPISQSDHFTLSYLDNTFTLRFSLLNYADAENTIFEHRLSSDEKWVRTTEGQNDITLSHLPVGTYHLEVRAIDNGEPTPSKIFTIVITPPWYRSTIAHIIYLIGLLGFLALITTLWWRHVRLNVEEEKMKFLINATHDIRSPLTLILGGIGKLKNSKIEELKSEEDLQSFKSSVLQPSVDTIDHNAQRILNLVNQILDIRKIDKQQMRLHCQKTDLKEFLQGVCKLYEFPAQERGITFTLQADDDVPPVWIDRAQFDKVVSNLLSNAFKYSYDQGEITIALSQGYDEKARGPLKQYVQVSVTDTGTGMREGTLQHLFDRFYQGTTTAHVEGTGIGLNLCKMIVDMHHGVISGRNRQDNIKGSVFTVRLPQGNSHLSEGEIDYRKDEPTSLQLKSNQKTATTYRILVVDDDEEIPRFISQELGYYYHFAMCRNGKDGLRELLTNSYDLVISDVMMPEMDGFTMLRMIRTNGNINHLPVVMLTSKTDIGNRLEGLERGADAYLTKPFSIEELHATIDNLIASRLRLRGKYSGTQMPNEQIKKIEVKGNDEQLMERIIDSINKHLSDSDFSVEMLCDEVGMSRANLHRKMKQMTGITASDFLRNLRMEQAARLLSEQKVNITQVAYSVGFSSLPYFSTAFKKHFGISPTEYIEKLESETK